MTSSIVMTCIACGGTEFTSTFYGFNICNGCGLGQLPQRLFVERIENLAKSGYDESDNFAPYDAGEADHKRRLSEKIEIGFNAIQGRGDILRKPDFGQMFEIGFGNAYIMEAFRKRGWMAHGIDQSKVAVDSAAKRGLYVFRGQFDNPDEISSRMVKWSWKDEHNTATQITDMDLVVAWDAMEHMPDLLGAFRTAAIILKKGGVFAMHSPCLPSYVGDPQHPHWLDKSHLWHMSVGSAVKLAQKAGLELKRQEVASTWGDSGYAHAQNFCLWAVKP